MSNGSSSRFVGRTLSHYRIVERLGAGGMGQVYRAHDEKLDRDVALKVLPEGALGDEDARGRFRKEAHALSRLSHPHIAHLLDFDSEDGIDFLVMELVAGPSLDEALRQGPLPEKDVLRPGSQLARGLQAAHDQGVVHRDLKPSNLALTRWPIVAAGATIVVLAAAWLRPPGDAADHERPGAGARRRAPVLRRLPSHLDDGRTPPLLRRPAEGPVRPLRRGPHGRRAGRDSDTLRTRDRGLRLSSALLCPDRAPRLAGPVSPPDGRSLLFSGLDPDTGRGIREFDLQSRAVSVFEGAAELLNPKCGPQGQVLALRPPGVGGASRPAALMARWPQRGAREEIGPATVAGDYPTWSRGGLGRFSSPHFLGRARTFPLTTFRSRLVRGT